MRTATIASITKGGGGAQIHWRKIGKGYFLIFYHKNLIHSNDPSTLLFLA